MSLRMIALDLYRLQKEVDRLENQIKASPPVKREELQDKLRKAKAERDRVKRMLEGTKEDLPYRKPR
jgi:peptidoglycan hydrolase CwlO-like protein